MKSASKYFDNKELKDFLFEMRDRYPRFVDLEVIGESSMGESIWLVTLTDKEFKHHSEKPGFWVDANIHASEVTGTQGVCYLIETLLKENSDSNSKNKELLKKITYYFLPRFSPDGARAFFQEKNSCRSTPLSVPYHSVNFKRTDLDGDGEVTLMRWPDPAGQFKEMRGHPGVLVPRLPTDFPFDGEIYYQVVPEGIWENFDGFDKTKNYDFGYDFNRQSSSFFAPEGVQKGAGAVPFQFPETKAVSEAIRKRKNIFGAIAYHTYGGFIINTPANVSESQLPLEDMLIKKTIAKTLGSKTGYSCHSGSDDFVYVPGQPLPGTFDEWYYLHLGILGITIEFWDLWKEAGMTWERAVEKYETLSEVNMEKLLKWAKENLNSEDYFLPWKKVKHPQIGDVEIGGFKSSFFITNPPLKFLEKEISKVAQASLDFSKMAPQVEIRSSKCTPLGHQLFQLDIVVMNSGYLPSYGSQRALDVKSVEEPQLKLALLGTEVISGPKTGEIKHLAGFSDGSPRISPFFGTQFSHNYEQHLRWVLKGTGKFTFEIDYFKGGVVRESLSIS